MDAYSFLRRAPYLAALLWLFPFTALAQRNLGAPNSEWILLGRNENAVVYLDQRSVQRQGDLARVYQLTDFTMAQWIDARTVIGSLKALVEYDCKEARARTIALEAFPEQMGEGRLLANEQNPNASWETLAPDGTGEIAHRLICRN